MIEITTQRIGENEVNAVDARRLHEFLGVKSEFRNWIKNRIEKWGFAQGVDFIAGNFLPGSEQKDYTLSIDMAKELSMVERNERGKQARQYFIECERRLKEPDTLPDHIGFGVTIDSFSKAADAMRLGKQERVQIVQSIIEWYNMPAYFVPGHYRSKGRTFSATMLLKRNGCDINVNAFNSLLISNGFMSFDGGDKILVGQGLRYGQNDMHTRDPHSTKPRYYEDTFMELYRKVTLPA